MTDDKWQALDAFWNSFGWTAYDESSVPDNAKMPYITYSAAVATFENPIPLGASLWDYSTSWEQISQKADEIAKAISPYRLQSFGNGEYIFATQGSPFAQRMNKENDLVKRVYINVMAEFFSAS